MAVAIHKNFIATVLFLSSSGVVGQPIEHEFGLVEQIDEDLHFYSASPDLPAGSQLYVLDSGERLQIVGPVGPAAKSAVVLIGSESAFAYLVSGSIERFSSVAVVIGQGSGATAVSGFRASSCTSSEGIHYSVWEASGEREARIWSAYRHLNYSVEATCLDSEFAERLPPITQFQHASWSKPLFMGGFSYSMVVFRVELYSRRRYWNNADGGLFTVAAGIGRAKK